MQLPGRTYSSSTGNYRYGFNGQEKDNEIKGEGNTYTAQFWEYASRSGRRWNLDPVTKPWQSGYSVMSDNPIWKIDPNGDDDYFNADGTFSHRTKTGTAIKLITKDGTKLLSQIQPNNTFNRHALTNIVAHYSPYAGIPGGTIVGISPSTSNVNDATTNETTNKPSLAYTNTSGIFVSAKNGINPRLDNYNNLISTLFHENKHRENGDPEKEKSTFSDHTNVYEKQIGDNKTFSATDKPYKVATAVNYASYLLGALNTNEIDDDDFDAKISAINTKFKPFGITIDAQRELGSGVLKPIKVWVKGDDGKYKVTDKPINAQVTPN